MLYTEKNLAKRLYKSAYFKDRVDKRNFISYEQDLRFIEKILKKRDKVLDYGCGEMIFTKFLERNYDTYIYDISPYIIKKDDYIKRKKFSDSKIYSGIVLRGVLQHLPNPFFTLEKLSNNIKINGKIIFLATPNTSSPYYFLNSDLPLLDPDKNFWVPSKNELVKVMRNLGFELEELQYPYIGSGYEKPLRDHFYFILNLFGIRKKYPFWRSVMNLSFKKCINI